MTFDQIAMAFLQENGFEVLECKSAEEAVEKAENLKKGSNLYPVYFSGSDTSGEKGYEEFFTDTESVDLGRLRALGVVTNKPIPDKDKIKIFFEELTDVFRKKETNKEEVIAIMKSYLPNFEHIETGRSLDSKM